MKTVYLVAPSFSAPESEIALTKNYLESLGLKTILPPELIKPDLFYANTDEVRASYLKEALEDPSIDYIWSVAGGYGASRVVPYLFPVTPPEKKKWFIGFSDATALHLFLNQQWDWPSIHGPTARQISMKTIGQRSIDIMQKLFWEGFSSPDLPPLKPLNKYAKDTCLEGTIVGGNLSLVQSSVGTPWQIQGKNKIIFLEEIGERGYRVDRMLTHLQQAHIFDGAKAVILGEFIAELEKDGTNYVTHVIDRFVGQINLPVYSLPHVGHGKENLPLPLNIPISLSVENFS